jgi:hypothetical protein
VPELMMEARNVGAGHGGHAQPTDRRHDEAAELAPIFLRRARLQADGDVLPIEPLSQLRDRDLGPSLARVPRRVLALLDCGEQAERYPARLLGGQHAMQAEAHAPVAY